MEKNPPSDYSPKHKTPNLTCGIKQRGKCSAFLGLGKFRFDATPKAESMEEKNLVNWS